MNLLALIGIVLLCLSTAAGQQPCAAPPRPAQQLEARLSQRADFVARGASVVEQLVEVARRYRIPMGIEWVEQTAPGQVQPTGVSDGTVLDLLNAVLRNSPTYQVQVYEGVVHVSDLTAAASRNNFLNLVLPRYRVENANLFRAESRLRLMINVELFPELYKDGFGGGDGYQLDHPLAATCVNLSGTNLTVRDVLDGIVRESDSALWVVRLTADELKAKRPGWRQKAPNEYGNAAINTRWEFIPLDSAPRARPGGTPDGAPSAPLRQEN